MKLHKIISVYNGIFIEKIYLRQSRRYHKQR